MKIQIPNEQSRIMINISNENSNQTNFSLLQNNNQQTPNKQIISKNLSKIKRCSYRYIKPRYSSIVIISEPDMSHTSFVEQNGFGKICGYRYLKPSVQLESICSIKSKQFVNEEQLNQTKKSLIDNKDVNIHSIIGDIEEIPLSHTSTIIESLQNVNANQESENEDNHSITAVSKKKKISKAREKKKIMLQDKSVQELFNEYKQAKDQNSLKNIREAFLRHINSDLPNNLKDIYVSRMGGNLKFGQIKKKINFNLKGHSINNKCIKFMCKSNQVRPIFFYFLENIEEFWLNESKIQAKEQYIKIAAFLIKIINDIKFIDLIEHYHTKL